MFVCYVGQGDKKETRTNGQKAKGGETWELGINTEKILLGIVVLLPALCRPHFLKA